MGRQDTQTDKQLLDKWTDRGMKERKTDGQTTHTDTQVQSQMNRQLDTYEQMDKQTGADNKQTHRHTGG